MFKLYKNGFEKVVKDFVFSSRSVLSELDCFVNSYMVDKVNIAHEFMTLDMTAPRRSGKSTILLNLFRYFHGMNYKCLMVTCNQGMRSSLWNNEIHPNYTTASGVLDNSFRMYGGADSEMKYDIIFFDEAKIDHRVIRPYLRDDFSTVLIRLGTM